MDARTNPFIFALDAVPDRLAFYDDLCYQMQPDLNLILLRFNRCDGCGARRETLEGPVWHLLRANECGQRAYGTLCPECIVSFNAGAVPEGMRATYLAAKIFWPWVNYFRAATDKQLTQAGYVV